MALVVNVDGKEYISVDELIKQMVTLCVSYTETDDVVVYEGERERVEAYQTLAKMLPLTGIGKKFHDEYVRERFVERTIGV